MHGTMSLKSTHHLGLRGLFYDDNYAEEFFIKIKCVIFMKIRGLLKPVL